MRETEAVHRPTVGPTEAFLGGGLRELRPGHQPRTRTQCWTGRRVETQVPQDTLGERLGLERRDEPGLDSGYDFTPAGPFRHQGRDAGRLRLHDRVRPSVTASTVDVESRLPEQGDEV